MERIKPDYIFMVGMPKCGTTALAGWLTNHGLAQYIVPGIKEPHILSAHTTPSLPPPTHSLPWLDASQSYAESSSALARMPDHGVKIIFCFRNPFERAWSAYKMFKIYAEQNENASTLLKDYIVSSVPADTEYAQLYGTIQNDSGYQGYKNLITRFFPRKSTRHVEKYFEAEMDRIRQGNFEQRLKYESAFYFSHRAFPFLSSLPSSLYYQNLKNYLQKYQPEDIIALSVNTLHSPEKRAAFLRRLLGESPALPEVPFAHSSENLAIDEKRPDFMEAKWDNLREIFSYDFKQYSMLMKNSGIATDLLDFDDLQRYLAV